MAVLFRSLINKAVQELDNNPETRAKVKKVYDDEVKPREQSFYKEHEGEIASAKDTALKGAARFVVQVKKKLKET